jgi:hypothetical protein
MSDKNTSFLNLSPDEQLLEITRETHNLIEKTRKYLMENKDFLGYIKDYIQLALYSLSDAKNYLFKAYQLLMKEGEKDLKSLERKP